MLRTLKTRTLAFVALFALLIAYALVADVSAGDQVSLPGAVEEINNHPATAKPVHFDKERIPQYRSLAAEIGMDYDRIYGYQEWADGKRKNKLGVAGHYEMLNFSTKGEPEDQKAMYASMREPHHWESFYFSNHDITMLYVIQPAGAGRSSVQILKLEKGRAPEIHK